MWRLPFGAAVLGSSTEQPDNELAESKATEFRLWASRARRVELQIVELSSDREQVVRRIPLERGARHLFRAIIDDCPAGTLYRFGLDGKQGRPDPYSRFQPFGVHGPSQIIDPACFRWTDVAWQGIAKRDLVIYELHVGSFTREGTYSAAIEKLPQLIELGVNAIELLPLAQSPGRWNWGYDGVNFFAPRNSFGTPEELKALVDAAHAMGLAVIHDVVYNHVGPEGNYLNEFAHYRSVNYGTPWGDSLDFDRRLVRDFIIENGIYWLDEFHFDGLRLDAIHYMFDDSSPHIVTEFAQRFRKYQATCGRQLHLIAESNIFDEALLQQGDEQSHYDAIWSDCLMHSLYSHGKPDLRLTNRHYNGTSDLVEALEHAYVFTAPGAIRVTDTSRRGMPVTEDRGYKGSLVMALQTHDSVGNHPHGKRLHHLLDAEFQRAAVPLILLYPAIPMLFMGEEWATSAPFPFFADFEDPILRQAVDRGRQAEYPHHDWSGSPLPSDPLAFLSSKLDDGNTCQHTWNWYQQILALRRRGIVEGWLEGKYKRTQYDPDREIFTLTYEKPGHRVMIASRLARDSFSPVRCRFSPQGRLLLDSNENQVRAFTTPDAVPEFEFSKNHCCIWEWEASFPTTQALPMTHFRRDN